MQLLVLYGSATLFLSSIQLSLSFGITNSRLRRSKIISSRLHEQIDRQSDSKYGRGIEHISADINEGDVISYQDGTWYVDGTEVGDGSVSRVRYCLVDTIQIVWTHDCEHGLVYGFALTVIDNGVPVSDDEFGVIVKKGNKFIVENDSYVQCGPEQILCRLPVTSSEEVNWNGVKREAYASLAEFDPTEEVMVNL